MFPISANVKGRLRCTNRVGLGAEVNGGKGVPVILSTIKKNVFKDTDIQYGSLTTINQHFPSAMRSPLTPSGADVRFRRLQSDEGARALEMGWRQAGQEVGQKLGQQEWLRRRLLPPHSGLCLPRRGCDGADGIRSHSASLVLTHDFSPSSRDFLPPPKLISDRPLCFG